MPGTQSCRGSDKVLPQSELLQTFSNMDEGNSLNPDDALKETVELHGWTT